MTWAPGSVTQVVRRFHPRQRGLATPAGLGGGRVGALLAADHFLEPLLRLAFDLAHPLARHAELLADLLEGEYPPAFEAEAVDDDGLLLVGEVPERQPDEPLVLVLDELVLGIHGAAVHEIVRDRRGPITARRVVERQLPPPHPPA